MASRSIRLSASAAGPTLAGLGILLALACTLAPGVAQRAQLTWLVQGTSELAAGVLCACLAVRVHGRSRWFWSLVGAWMSLYGAAALAFGASTLAGWGAAAAGDLDVLWVPSYVPLVGALLLLYRELVGAWRWSGLLDSFAVACALSLFVWEGVVAPVGAGPDGMLAHSAGLAVFAGLDLFCVCLVALLILHGGLRPRWIAGLLGALLAQSGSDVLYLRASALDEAASLWVSSCLAILSAALVATMVAHRRLTGDRARLHGPMAAAPFWTQLLPLPVCFAAGVLAVLRPGERHLGVLALLGLILLMGRLVIVARRSEHLARENALLARIDPLTGAENRRVLEEELQRALSLADRSGGPVAVVALDLDRFKAVNDRFGHAVGDRLLVAAAGAMRDCLRSSDRLYRLGGDEFLVLAPGSSSGDALALAERLVAAVARVSATLAPEVGATASAGVAAYPHDARGGTALLRCADDALYAAKGSGAGRALSAA